MWQATYLDGSVLKQRMAGEQVSSELIDRDKTRTFSLLKDDVPIITVTPTRWQRFFYRKRTRMTAGSVVQICHILGLTEDSKLKDVWFCFEGGKTHRLQQFVNNHPWFYQVNFKEQEI
jgi:hypothetical protein